MTASRTLRALHRRVPYASNEDLPPAVQRLPDHAQDIFRMAFNAAFAREHDEGTAFRIAWSAVNRSYEKLGEDWVLR